MRGLDAQHGRLQCVHPEIAPDDVVVVLRLHPVRPQEADAARERVVVRRDEARVAKRAQVLAREEREAAEHPDAANLT